jgi:hypothetical protein
LRVAPWLSHVKLDLPGFTASPPRHPQAFMSFSRVDALAPFNKVDFS